MSHGRADIALELYGASYDFPQGAPADRRYFILSTPRVGSTLLSRLLRQVPGAGLPLEYLNPIHKRSLSTRLRTKGNSYAAALLQRRSAPGGWFGLKLHAVQGLDHANRPTEDFHALINSNAIYFRLKRIDRLAQAVSLAHARMTGRWQPGVSLAGSEPMFSHAAIDEAEEIIGRQERSWDAFLQTIPSTAIVNLSYEALVQDIQGTIDLIVRRLDLSPCQVEVNLGKVDAKIKADWLMRLRSS